MTERVARLVEVIRGSGLTKSAFAARVGISPSNVSEFIHGRQGLPVALAERIARAFGVSAGWLLFGEGGGGTAVGSGQSAVAEGEAGYGRGLRLARVGGGEAVELPAGALVYEVEGDELAPVWRAGQRLIVVRAAKGEGGPGIVRRGRTAWRVVAVIL